MGSFVDPNTGKRVNAPGIASDLPASATRPRPARPRPPGVRPGAAAAREGRAVTGAHRASPTPYSGFPGGRPPRANRPAPRVSPAPRPAPRSAPIPRPAPAASAAPAAPKPTPTPKKVPGKKPPVTPVRRGTPKKGTLLAKATAAKGSGKYSKDEFNRALSRYRRTHRGVSMGNARTIASYLASRGKGKAGSYKPTVKQQENARRNRAAARFNPYGGPDSPR